METASTLTSKTIQDLRHLQGLPSAFASRVDIVLCVRQGPWNLGFPVHQSIVSAHSPVLCEAILDLQPAKIQADTQSAELLRLPLVGDTCSAVQAALRHMYESCTWAARRSKKRQQEVLLWEASDCAEHITFAHKYAMDDLLQSQQKTLLNYLCKLRTSATMYSHSPDCAFVLKCIAVAEELGLIDVLQACEAIIAANFEAFMLPKPLASKLGPSSMLAIATAAFRGQQKVAANMRSAYDSYTGQVETFLTQICMPGKEMQCPECRQAIKVEVQRHDSDTDSVENDSTHDASRGHKFPSKVIVHSAPVSLCKWPRLTPRVSGPEGADIETWVADVHQSWRAEG